MTIEWFGLEGALKITWYNSVTVSRDTFNQSRLLRPHPAQSDHKNYLMKEQMEAE